MRKFYLVASVFLALLIIYMVVKSERNSLSLYTSFGVSLPYQANILGIDVSHHQGVVEWNAVDSMKIGNDSLQFVYLKVTEGNNFTDSEYKRNRDKLNQMALKVGVYHFLSPVSSVESQAAHFTNSFERTTLKPVLDVETIGDLTKDQLVNRVSEFLDQVELNLNVRPIIYTYESFYLDYIKGTKLESEFFWIANYNPTCTICDQDNVLLWQFSEQGTVNGISEKVDLNSANANFWDNIIWE